MSSPYTDRELDYLRRWRKGEVPPVDLLQDDDLNFQQLYGMPDERLAQTSEEVQSIDPLAGAQSREPERQVVDAPPAPAPLSSDEVMSRDSSGGMSVEPDPVVPPPDRSTYRDPEPEPVAAPDRATYRDPPIVEPPRRDPYVDTAPVPNIDDQVRADRDAAVRAAAEEDLNRSEKISKIFSTPIIGDIARATRGDLPSQSPETATPYEVAIADLEARRAAGAPVAEPEGFATTRDGKPVTPATAAATRAPMRSAAGGKAVGPGGGSFERQYVQGRDMRKNPLGMPVTPEEQALMIQRSREMGELGVMAAERDVAAGQQVAAAHVGAEAAKAAYTADMIERDRARTEMLVESEGKLRDMWDRVLEEPIDANRHWNSKSTGEKILARLAMALGAIGSGLAGVPNYAFEEMRDAIRNDLEAQKLNKAFMRDRAVAEGSIVQMARARFEDERMQDVAMQQSAWKLMDAELGRFAVMAKLPAQQAGIEAMRTQVFAELEDLDHQFRTANDAFVLRRLAAQQAAAAAQAKARADAMRTRREALEDETYVPGWGWARGKIEGRKMRQAQTDYYDAKQAFRELRGMARNWKTKVGTDTLGTGLFKGGTKEWAAARAAAARLQTKVAKAFGGVITDSDRAEAAKQVPDPTSMRDFNIDEALNAAERALDRNARAAIGSTIIGAPTDIIPTLPGDEPDVPLPQGQTETPAAGAAQSRGRGSAKTRQER